MNIILGKITEDGRDRAYMLYSITDQKRKIMTRNAVKEALISGDKVVGFELNYNSYGRYNLHKSKHCIWKNMTELNGKGKPETENGKAVETFIGTNGFKEVKVYLTIDNEGYIRIYSKDDFITRLSESADTIVGAGLVNDTEDKELVLYIKNTLTDTWMERLGYKRDDDFNWVKLH